MAPTILPAMPAWRLLGPEARDGAANLAADEAIAEALAAGLAPPTLQLRPACYGTLTPYEVVVGGRRRVGSAQLRRRGVVLHEGGILLRFDAAATARWLAAPSPDARRERAARLDAAVTDLQRELG